MLEKRAPANFAPHGANVSDLTTPRPNMKKNHVLSKNHDGLVCPACGNQDRFIEVMYEEAHLVNGRRDYIRLLEGIVDRYLCWACGATVETQHCCSRK